MTDNSADKPVDNSWGDLFKMFNESADENSEIVQELTEMLEKPYLKDIVNSLEFIGITAHFTLGLNERYEKSSGNRDIDLAISVVALTLTLIDRPLTKSPISIYG